MEINRLVWGGGCCVGPTRQLSNLESVGSFWIYHRPNLWKWVCCSTSESAAFRSYPWLQGSMESGQRRSLQVTSTWLRKTRFLNLCTGACVEAKAMAWISRFERSIRNSGVRLWFHKHHEGMFWLYSISFPHCSQGILKGTALNSSSFFRTSSYLCLKSTFLLGIPTSLRMSILFYNLIKISWVENIESEGT